MGEREVNGPDTSGIETKHLNLLKDRAFEMALSANCIADASGMLIHANTAFLHIWGWTEERQVLGQSIGDFLNLGAGGSSVLEILDKKGSWEGELSGRRRNGIPFRAFAQATVVVDEQGNHIGYQSSVQDVTERKRAEEAQKESEERFRILFEGAPDAIFIADTQTGKILDANRTACRMLGRTREEIMEMSQSDLHPPRIRDHAREIFYLHIGQSQNYGYTPPTEIAILRKDGTEIPVEVVAQTIRLYKQTVLMGTFRDITERKQAEEKLRRKEEMIRNINDNLVSGMIYQILGMKDGSRKFTYLSDSVQRFYGVTAEKARQNADLIYGRVADEDKLRVRQIEEEAARNLSVLKLEVRMKNPDGTIRWSSFVSNPTLLEDGTTRWDGIELDITERKRAEEALRESELKANAMLQAIPDMMFRLDGNGVFLDYKADQAELYYRGAPTFVGKHIRDVIPPELAQLTEHYIGEALKTGSLQTYEYRLPIPEKGVQDYEARMIPSGENEVTVIVRNITGNKRAGTA